MIASAIDQFVILLFLALIIAAAIGDVIAYRIPNRLVACIAALYPIHVLAASLAPSWIGSLAIAGLILLAGSALFSLGLIGGGDVKLAAAIGLWAGPGLAFDFLFGMALAGGVIALAMLSPLRFALAEALGTRGHRAARDAVLGRELPYGVAIAVGGAIVAGQLMLRSF